jgi:hypothetical protein
MVDGLGTVGRLGRANPTQNGAETWDLLRERRGLRK